MKKPSTQAVDSKIDMTPMLDVIFIMLIFFIVTTAFVRESGIEIAPPQASETPGPDKQAPILVQIAADNIITIDGRVTDIARVEAYVSGLRGDDPKRTALVVTDAVASTEVMVRVVDSVRNAGIGHVPVALASR